MKQVGGLCITLGLCALIWGPPSPLTALILLFYFVFYAFLTALFCLTMWVMLQTIDDYHPKYSDRLANPGLMIRPKTSGLEIVYGLTDEQSWSSYVSALNIALQDYNTSVQEVRNSVCVPGVYNKQDDNGDVRNYPKKACQFPRKLLQNCSGEEDGTYGYREGAPCVLIKMNRVINFIPVINKDLSNSSITINCSAKRLKSALNDSGDQLDLLLGPRVYFPSNAGSLGTMDLMYFPYYGNKAQKNYSQPLVAIKFLNMTRGVDHNVECRINAVNIQSNIDRDRFAGRVSFKLHIAN
ncbi:sodium/potassium-transporting ATPase subunit beta-2-like [Ascaphus truei]|uniref:sodium/potassium-transporting ATPase subunit beta-2-like n=1 Tax=Ascaphus truei TaxID=8439 RepID=UPI003F592E1C